MSKGIDQNLATISRGKMYVVSGFVNAATPYAEKLHKMGFVVGTPVALAPVKMSDPMIVQIRGGRIALRKNEASQIIVKES